MRKITEESIDAFYAKRRFKKRNMQVVVNDDEVLLLLHDNIIAKLVNDDLFIDSCGWNSNTTRDRLNGLKNVWVRTQNGQMILNEQSWDGKLTQII